MSVCDKTAYLKPEVKTSTRDKGRRINRRKLFCHFNFALKLNLQMDFRDVFSPTPAFNPIRIEILSFPFPSSSSICRNSTRHSEGGRKSFSVAFLRAKLFFFIFASLASLFKFAIATNQHLFLTRRFCLVFLLLCSSVCWMRRRQKVFSLAIRRGQKLFSLLESN